MLKKLSYFKAGLIGFAFLIFAFLFHVSCYMFHATSVARAAEYTFDYSVEVNNYLLVNGDIYANQNNIFFNPNGFPGVDPTIDFKRGGSMILESGDLFILSDDFIHIGSNHYGSPVGKVLIQEPWEIAEKARTAHGTLAAGLLETNDMIVRNNISIGGIFEASQFVGNLIGNASTSTDADMLDGQHGAYYLDINTSFAGDVSGKFDSIAVADDSHGHTGATLSGILFSNWG